MDEKTVNYSQKRFDEICKEMKDYLLGLGFKDKKL